MDRIEAALRTAAGAHPHDLVEHVARELALTEPQVEAVLQGLLTSGVLAERISASGREILWKPLFEAAVTPELQEHRVWQEHLEKPLGDVPQNVQQLLYYGFTEMLNNVVDHSGAKRVVVVLRRLPGQIEIYIEDDGEGIFRKLQREKGLEDPRHVALELSKGKLTTDPARHSGEGIFFTARMCDHFLIWSGTTACGHVDGREWHVRPVEHREGTTVRLVVRLDTRRTPRAVFDEYAPGVEGGFSKTAFEVSLALPAGEELVSRSQARRLLARCDQFREVALDFRGIESIGPAFADEAFRVFPGAHPGLEVRAVNTSEPVQRMIDRAVRRASPPG